MEITKIKDEETLLKVARVITDPIDPGLHEFSQILPNTSFIEVNSDDRSTKLEEDIQVLHNPEIYHSIKTPGLDQSSNIIQKSPFIEANTEVTTLFQLENECTTAVFSKDNELTIAHHDFIMAMHECASKVFGNEVISEPDIRVSHVIKGRIPEALRKPVQELLPHEKTMYWERLAFVIEIPTITRVIGGNTLTLCVGGVRALNHLGF